MNPILKVTFRNITLQQNAIIYQDLKITLTQVGSLSKYEMLFCLAGGWAWGDNCRTESDQNNRAPVGPQILSEEVTELQPFRNVYFCSKNTSLLDVLFSLDCPPPTLHQEHLSHTG